MPTWTFVKAVGAPTGKITFDLSELSFFLNDTTQLTFVTSDPQTAGDADAHPYLSLSGLPTGAPAPQQIQGVELVDGVLSTQGPGGTYVPLAAGVFATSTAQNPSANFAVTTSNQNLVPARARSALEVYNLDSTAKVYIALSNPASLSHGALLNPNGGRWRTPQDTGGMVWTGPVYIIGTGAATVSFVEV